MLAVIIKQQNSKASKISKHREWKGASINFDRSQIYNGLIGHHVKSSFA